MIRVKRERERERAEESKMIDLKRPRVKEYKLENEDGQREREEK